MIDSNTFLGIELVMSETEYRVISEVVEADNHWGSAGITGRDTIVL